MHNDKSLVSCDMMKWTAYVQQDGDELVLPLPDEMLAQLEWRVGDVLLWSVNEDGTITLTKKAKWYQRLWKRITSW